MSPVSTFEIYIRLPQSAFGGYSQDEPEAPVAPVPPPDSDAADKRRRITGNMDNLEKLTKKMLVTRLREFGPTEVGGPTQCF